MTAGKEKETRVGGKSLELPWKLGAISYQTFPLAPPSLFQLFHLSITASHPQSSPSPPFLRSFAVVLAAAPLLFLSFT